jgi:alpha-beta hydrolase superfamily lysophospholipase
MTEGTFKGAFGVKIFTREWQPAGESRGVVVISHGLNAHSGLYVWAAQQFTSNGLAVHALDHRGRGRSGGKSWRTSRRGSTRMRSTQCRLKKAYESVKASRPDRYLRVIAARLPACSNSTGSLPG